MKIGFLGTSSAFVTSDRDNTSIFVQTHSRSILIDCSGNTAGKLLRLGFDPNQLDLILLTHLHIDHCYGLPALLFHMFLGGRTQTISIAAPDDEFDHLDAQLLSHGIENDVRSFAIKRIPVRSECHTAVWSAEDLLITAAPGEHTRASRAYRIHDLPSSRSIVFSGDTRPCSTISQLAFQTDMLIHEATYLESERERAERYCHSTAHEAGMIAKDAEAQTLALIHLELSSGVTPTDYADQASSAFGGNIIIPSDLEIVSVNHD